MAGVKTAISIDEDLFHQVNKLASEMHVSRSKLFALAVQDYLNKQENRKLLAQLNAAYSDTPNVEESKVSHSMRNKQRKLVEQESW